MAPLLAVALLQGKQREHLVPSRLAPLWSPRVISVLAPSTLSFPGGEGTLVPMTVSAFPPKN